MTGSLSVPMYEVEGTGGGDCDCGNGDCIVPALVLGVERIEYEDIKGCGEGIKRPHQVWLSLVGDEGEDKGYPHEEAGC